ncbi:glycosyl transferase, group 1 family protein [Calothrix sp. NIES-4071]|nr:glycosyl transferase, group 1 family protein [Calothrix sp. NIES-4071]BAZ62666.1 glycosyl transferase, group 1 family protein [Calothrix sp. NIES-4105]
MKIAYLVNQYPKVSHSFIRREISALEAAGLSVTRFSIRSSFSELVDPEDKLEYKKTRVILDVGVWGLLLSLVSAIVKPVSFLSGLYVALKVGIKSDAGLLRHIIYLAEACTLKRWLYSCEATHLHVHFGTNSTTVAMLCHVMGGPEYSFTVHGPEEFDRASNIALTEKINRAKFVIAICSFGLSQLYRWCDYEQWQKIHIIRCGVDDDYFDQPQTNIRNVNNLVCVGRLCEQKGQILLLEAIKQLRDEGWDLQLTLVGDGEMRSQLETIIQDYGLHNCVKITGWATGTEVQHYIEDARALILPSFAEGLPVVLMEALALRRPVISTYVAGIPELVQSDVNGWLVPAGSVEALVAAIKKVLVLPAETLMQMGVQGVVTVRKQHNVTTEAYKLAALLADNQNNIEIQQQQLQPVTH